MEKMVLLSIWIFSFDAFSVGESSTFFQVFVLPKSDRIGRDVSLIVTAIYNSTSFSVVDNDMNGDDDVFFSGMLMAGQSYILYIGEAGINDDALHSGKGTTKQEVIILLFHLLSLCFFSNPQT